MTKQANVAVEELAQITKAAFDRVEKKLETFATKEELHEVKIDLSEVKDDLRQVKTMAEKTMRVQDSILTTVQSIDGQLKGMGDHEERIERLEETVFTTPRRSRRTVSR